MSILSRPSPGAPQPGAEAALKADYEQFYGRARLFAVRHLGDVWADDIVQDAFVRLWSNWYKEGQEVPRESSRRMFFHILRNLIVDRARQRLREQERNAHPAFLSAPHLRLERAAGPVQVADASILAERIEYHVDRMPEALRRVHRASVDHDGDVPTIARVLGIKETSVSMQLWRARTILRDQLRKDGYDLPGKPEVHQAKGP